jgi:hypothetical protein
MKRKPDAIVAIVLIFCLCLVVSGFSGMVNKSEPVESVEVSTLP